MLLEFLISASLCFTITKLTVIIHELGHVFALFITKKKLNLELPTVTSIFTFGLYGRTFSPVYFYLKKYKYKKEIRSLIKFNAIMGPVFEFIFLFTLLRYSFFSIRHVQSIDLYGKVFLYSCVFVFSLGLLLIPIISFTTKSSSDINSFIQPKYFSYSNYLPHIEGKYFYILLPIIIYFSSYILSNLYVFYLKLSS